MFNFVNRIIRRENEGDKSNFDFLDNITFGEKQIFQGICVYPVFFKDGYDSFITLKSAIENNYIKISEVNQGGSVPELRIINFGDVPVLLLDGEELAGAKQNRVLNTSILVYERSNIIIPVSCTEEGRWNNDSKYFYDSDEIMEWKIRASKTGSVSDSLQFDNQYKSDQGEVWDGIRNFSHTENVHSNTGAMKAVYNKEKSNLNTIIKHFPNQDKQKGFLLINNNTVAGLEIVGSSSAYSQYHDKLLRSYLIGSDIQLKDRGNGNHNIIIDEFFKEIKSCSVNFYQSVGYGWDLRFKNASMVGSGLVHDKEIVHIVIFNKNDRNRHYRRHGGHY